MLALAFVYFCVGHPVVPSAWAAHPSLWPNGDPGPRRISWLLQPQQMCVFLPDWYPHLSITGNLVLVLFFTSAAFFNPTACLWPPHLWQYHGIHTWRVAACPRPHHQACHYLRLLVGGWWLAKWNLFIASTLFWWWTAASLCVQLFCHHPPFLLSSVFNLWGCCALALSPKHFILASGELSGMTETGFSEVVLGQTYTGVSLSSTQTARWWHMWLVILLTAQ